MFNGQLIPKKEAKVDMMEEFGKSKAKMIGLTVVALVFGVVSLLPALEDDRGLTPASTAVSASGSGAAKRPATRSTAARSDSVPPAPPASSGSDTRGSSACSSTCQSAGDQPSR